MLAQTLDNPNCTAMYPAMCGRLQAVLQELHRGPKRKSKGRLAAVVQMTNGTMSR